MSGDSSFLRHYLNKVAYLRAPGVLVDFDHLSASSIIELFHKYPSYACATLSKQSNAELYLSSDP